MKKYRRIEITAFRRTVGVVTGRSPTAATDEKIIVIDADAEELINVESDEGKQVVFQAIRLLETQISDKRRP